MKRRRPVAIVSVLAIATAGLAGAGLASLTTGKFGFSEAMDERGFTLLSEGGSPAALIEAEAVSQAALNLSPYNNAARLRVAYIEASHLGRLGPKAVKAFQESYDLMPVDHAVAAWRIRFGLEHWSQLTPEIRSAVRYEALAFAPLPSATVNVREILGSIRDPSGALAAAFMLQEIQ